MSKRLLLIVRVKPSASNDEIVSVEGRTLSVRVKAPPEKGKANSALIELLSEALRLPKRSLTIVRGERSREKWIEVSDIDAEELDRRLKEI